MKRQRKVEEIQKWIDAKMPELMDDFFTILRIRSVAEPKALNPVCGGTYARKLPNAFAYGTGIPEQWPPKGVFLPGHGDFHQPDESISIKRIKTALLVYTCSICELDELDCLG